MSDSPQESCAEEPEVQGVPRSLIASLCGMAALLIGAGGVCVLCVCWGSLGAWVRAGVLAALPVAVSALHIWRSRRRGMPPGAVAFWFFLAANAVLAPLGIWLAVAVAPLAGVLCAVPYALAFMWYASVYRSSAGITAACTLCFSACLSILFSGAVSLLLGAAILALLGVGFLIAARWLHLRRKRCLARFQLACRNLTRGMTNDEGRMTNEK